MIEATSAAGRVVVAAVFISHRRDDAGPAERLARQLKAAGHEIWLDTWRIGIGDSVVARINEGLESAAYVVVCYSSAGVLSPWMSNEWMTALHRQLEQHRVKLLPVLLTGQPTQIPAVLQDLKYADLVTDWDAGVAELLRAIRSRLPPVPSPPSCLTHLAVSAIGCLHLLAAVRLSVTIL